MKKNEHTHQGNDEGNAERVIRKLSSKAEPVWGAIPQPTPILLNAIKRLRGVADEEAVFRSNEDGRLMARFNWWTGPREIFAATVLNDIDLKKYGGEGAGLILGKFAPAYVAEATRILEAHWECLSPNQAGLSSSDRRRLIDYIEEKRRRVCEPIGKGIATNIEEMKPPRKAGPGCSRVYTREEIRRVQTAIKEHGGTKQAAAHLGMPRTVVRRIVDAARQRDNRSDRKPLR